MIFSAGRRKSRSPATGLFHLAQLLGAPIPPEADSDVDSLEGSYQPKDLADQLAAAAAVAKWEQSHPPTVSDQQPLGSKAYGGPGGPGVAGAAESGDEGGAFAGMSDEEAYDGGGGAGGDLDTAAAESGGTPGGPGDERGEGDEEEEPFSLMKALKIAVPHVILLSVLLSYLAAGAVILQKLENGTETTKRFNKLVELDHLFDWVVNETWQLKFKIVQHEHGYHEWQAQVYERLQNISEFYFNRRLTKNPTSLETKWTFQTAILYTLTVLTACGYSHIDPITNEGMIFVVCYALLGIPLMFITAADIGKFLSETFTKAVQCGNDLQAKMVQKVRRFKRKKRHEKMAVAGSGGGGDTLDGLMVEAGNAKMDAADGETDDEHREEDPTGNNHNPAKWLMEEHLGENLWFPISAYFFLMCMYCSVGAILFRRYEDWNFIRAFHFAFNTVVTVGLGEIVVADAFYLCCIVVYVIIGLSVVTMCVDLASSHLQTYFQRIHYFGRAREHFLGMSEDLREMVGLLAALRSKKGGGKVTWQDLKALMDAEQERLYGKSFVPRHISRWRYVDDTTSSAALSSGRRHSSRSYTSSSVSASTASVHSAGVLQNKRSSAANRVPPVNGLVSRSPLPKVSCLPPPIPTTPRRTESKSHRRSKKHSRSSSRRKHGHHHLGSGAHPFDDRP